MNIRKGDHYQKEFKDQIMSFAAQTSITKTAQKFNVHHSSISKWINEKKFQELRNSAQDGDGEFESCGDLNIGKLCESSFIDWLSKNLNTVTYESIKEQVNLLKMIYQNIPTWLCNYAERLEHPDHKKGSARTLYPPQFKSLVVSYLDQTNLPQAKVSKIFSVPRKQLREWHKVYQMKGNLNKSERSLKNLLTSAEVDESIWIWFQSQSVPPSASSVKKKALSLYHERGHTDMKCSYGWYYKWCARYKVPYKEKHQKLETQLITWLLEELDLNQVPSHESIRLKATTICSDPNFKASAGWVMRFCRRHALVLGNQMVHNDLLPDFVRDRFTLFQSSLDKFISEQDLPQDSIGIVDEITLPFKNGPSLLPHSSLKNSLASVIIASDMKGSLLPLLLILKHSSHQIQVISEGLIVYQYAESNPFEKCYRYWLENIWFKQMTSPNLLLADSYSVHQKLWVLSMFESRKSFMKIVPPRWISLASKLSELTSRFNQSVYDSWKSSAEEICVDIDSSSVITWVSKAHDTIRQR